MQHIQEAFMDRSVHEARWLLAPVLALYIAFVAFGIFMS